MTDPLSILVVVFAITLLGIAKGGFGGVGAPVALPLMSLSLPPDLALGALLPILMSMDAVSVSAHRKHVVGRMLLYTLPAACVGILVGTWLLARVSADMIAAAVGVMAILFALQSLTKFRLSSENWPDWIAACFGAVSGLTSTLAHAGGPPIHAYLMSRLSDPVKFVATSAVFMAAVNLLKLGPFIAIGALDWPAFLTALALAPVAIIATYGGVRLARVLSKKTFAVCVNVLMMAVGIKLVFDALT